jgi:uncharacterized damage-inducible protein DinB
MLASGLNRSPLVCSVPARRVTDNSEEDIRAWCLQERKTTGACFIRYNGIMDIQRLLAYADSARTVLRQTLAAHPQTLDQSFETAAAYTTIGQLVAHLIGAERRLTLGWLSRQGRLPRYEDEAAQTLEVLFADWDAIRARTLAFAESADASALAHVIATGLPQIDATETLTAEDVLLHICNHQTWHLGQISMAWQQMGVDPPNFDYVLLRPIP